MPMNFNNLISFFLRISGRQPSVLKYEEGKTYIYNFETEVATLLVGSTDESSRIKVKGQAAVAVQSACDLVLTVQQIAITSSSGQVKKKSKLLIKYLK